MIRILLLLLLVSPAFAHGACVILLHGLARTDNSMNELERKLGDAGYTVINVHYPSRRHPIAELAQIAIPPAVADCGSGSEVNFVTHSLGGILVRQYLLDNNIDMLRHVVMLGPPNQGSEVIDKLGGIPGFNLINGEAGTELGSDAESVPNTLGPATFDVGIIAGTRSFNPLLSALIPGDDDGKVSIKSTRLEGMNDHIEMPATHSFMMNNNRVIAQVIYYLQHGMFERE